MNHLLGRKCMKSWTSPIFNERGKGNRPALQQQMKMIRDQRPSQEFGGCFGAKGSQATDEIVSIDIVLKNRTALNATTNNVVEGTRRIYAGLSKHGKIMSCHSKKQKRIFSWASPIFPVSISINQMSIFYEMRPLSNKIGGQTSQKR